MELGRLMNLIEAQFEALIISPTPEDMQTPEVALWREIGDARNI